jgi:disulfide bond formation protein DsbB
MTSARPLDKLAAGFAFLLGLATILGALGSQFLGGLQPCELCLEQRLPYYWGLPVLALLLVLWNRLPLPVWYLGLAIVTMLFAWSTYMGAFHSGVEWGFWPGPTACSGTGAGLSLSLESLNDLQPVIGCDVVQFRFLGLSLAGYNALISLAIVVLLLGAILFQARRAR